MEEKEEQTNNKEIKVLRTYTSDMAEAIRDNEVSVIKIALAEKEKRENEESFKKAEGSKASKVFLAIGGIILIAAAIAGSYYLIQQKKARETPLPIMNNVETFISYDSSSYVDTTKANNIFDLLKLIDENGQNNSGLIKAMFLTRTTQEEPEILKATDFLSLINSSAPGALTRSLSGEYLLGKYSNPSAVNEKNRSATFLIFETNNYNQAYVSMLDWEKTMLKDLFILFNINIPESDTSFFEKVWKDVIINNKDARVLYGENGEGVLSYVFVNKNIFVITDNTEALKEIITRLLIKNTKPM